MEKKFVVSSLLFLMLVCDLHGSTQKSESPIISSSTTHENRDDSSIEEYDSNPSQDQSNLQLPNIFKKIDAVYSITEVPRGCVDDENPIFVYVSPSCLHCADFLTKDLEAFLNKNGAKNKVIIRFLTTSLNDLFIMKLIQNKINEKIKEAPPHEFNGDISNETDTQKYETYIGDYIKRHAQDFYAAYFIQYVNYISKILNSITPTEDDVKKFKGSKKDKQMIKYQVGAIKSGLFSENDVINAIPNFGKNEKKNDDQISETELNTDPTNMLPKYEQSMMASYQDNVKYIASIKKNGNESKKVSIDLPIILRNDIEYKTLDEAAT